MRRLVALAAVAALFLVGCGGGGDDDTDPLAGGPMAGGATEQDHPHGGAAEGPAGGAAGGGGEHADHGGNPTSTCEPSGTTLSITAEDIEFDKDCLAAPANQPFTVTFENNDQTAHNLMILESHSATEALFDAGTIPAGTRTLEVGALRPGTFAFHCKIHPSRMSGTFVVK